MKWLLSLVILYLISPEFAPNIVPLSPKQLEIIHASFLPLIFSTPFSKSPLRRLTMPLRPPKFYRI